MTKKNVFQTLRIELETYEKQLFLFVDKSTKFKEYKDQKILDALAKKRDEFRNWDKLQNALDDVKFELLNANKAALADNIKQDFKRVKDFFRNVEKDLWDIKIPTSILGYILCQPDEFHDIKAILMRLEVWWKKTDRKSKTTKQEANLRARPILQGNPHITARNLAKEIGCSAGLVSQLPAWKAVQGELMKNHKPKSLKVVSLTTKIEETLPQNGTELENLIEEQKEDQKSDEGKHFHKRKKL